MQKWEYCQLRLFPAITTDEDITVSGTYAGVTYYQSSPPRRIFTPIGDQSKKPFYLSERNMLERMKAHQQEHDFKPDPLLDRLEKGPPTEDEEAIWYVEITSAFDAKISDLGAEGWEMLQVSEDEKTIWYKRRLE